MDITSCFHAKRVLSELLVMVLPMWLCYVTLDGQRRLRTKPLIRPFAKPSSPRGKMRKHVKEALHGVSVSHLAVLAAAEDGE